MPAHQHSASFRIISNALAFVAYLASMTVASAMVSDESEASFKQQIRLYCGSAIDGTSNHPLGSRTLTIGDGIIFSISKTPLAAKVDLDLSDYTCLPGLINTHVHFDANPDDAADYGVYARRTQADIIAVLGNPLTDMKRLREVSVVIKNGVVIKQPAQRSAP